MVSFHRDGDAFTMSFYPDADGRTFHFVDTSALCREQFSDTSGRFLRDFTMFVDLIRIRHTRSRLCEHPLVPEAAYAHVWNV